MTPRKLTLMNTTIQSVIQDISFQTSILAVRLNRKRYLHLSACPKQTIPHYLRCPCGLAEDDKQPLQRSPRPAALCLTLSLYAGWLLSWISA